VPTRSVIMQSGRKKGMENGSKAESIDEKERRK
jgi:hypothetical protein